MLYNILLGMQLCWPLSIFFTSNSILLESAKGVNHQPSRLVVYKIDSQLGRRRTRQIQKSYKIENVKTVDSNHPPILIVLVLHLIGTDT